MNKIRVTVSGSFRRHLPQVQEAVGELAQAGVEVLSPASPVVVDRIENFVFVASDVHRSPRLVQDRHLAAIQASDFLWLVCPDGYVGQSASLEVGYAVARGIPVWAKDAPNDLTLRQYVGVLSSCAEAVKMALRLQRATSTRKDSLLLDPVAATEEVHQVTANLRALLTSPSDKAAGTALEERVERERQRASKILTGH
jgi:nucleoside 2-deoxyribosyltransferase